MLSTYYTAGQTYIACSTFLNELVVTDVIKMNLLRRISSMVIANILRERG